MLGGAFIPHSRILSLWGDILCNVCSKNIFSLKPVSAENLKLFPVWVRVCYDVEA